MNQIFCSHDNKDYKPFTLICKKEIEKEHMFDVLSKVANASIIHLKEERLIG